MKIIITETQAKLLKEEIDELKLHVFKWLNDTLGEMESHKEELSYGSEEDYNVFFYLKNEMIFECVTKRGETIMYVDYYIWEKLTHHFYMDGDLTKQYLKEWFEYEYGFDHVKNILLLFGEKNVIDENYNLDELGTPGHYFDRKYERVNNIYKLSIDTNVIQNDQIKKNQKQIIDLIKKKLYAKLYALERLGSLPESYKYKIGFKILEPKFIGSDGQEYPITMYSVKEDGTKEYGMYHYCVIRTDRISTLILTHQYNLEQVMEKHQKKEGDSTPIKIMDFDSTFTIDVKDLQ
jgi:hypothetical protein